MTVRTGASERQASYIESLLHDRSLPSGNGEPVAESLVEAGASVEEFLGNITDRGEASGVIDTLLSYPRVGQAAGGAAAASTSAQVGRRAPALDPPVGVHLVEANPGADVVEHVVVKVQKSRTSGKAYAKRLDVIWNPDGSRHSQAWEYVARGDLFRRCSTETLITVEQAAEFGHRTGVCAICGRDLTVTESIDRGIGPVCFGRIG